VSRTLLLDADLLAYRASAANQRSYDWNGDGAKSVAADEAGARQYAEEQIESFVKKLKADDVIVCLSDDFNSFRKDRVDASYKAVREGVERPVHLYDIKDYLAETYDTVRWTSLEADDVMGILATDPARSDERIIVSADKDLMGVPARLHRPAVYNTQTGTLIRKAMTIDISPLEAIRFHFWQAIVGDTTDGFPGAYGVGPKSLYAEDVIEAESEEEAWDIVLQAFASVGQSEDDAVRQARLARILQHSDWDGRTPRLWLPPAWEELAPVSA
jgi:DNA polymerase-1